VANKKVISRVDQLVDPFNFNFKTGSRLYVLKVRNRIKNRTEQ
jgi:hypothetical protein